ncbi:hypothetical protein SeLEV6574_g02283 [Synchytrium endobioticum]|uniref:FAD/NAD(P)-binding domain-containing protein n=1 Tax=Synchytrium endobioticum TaxID=286115 RepID=A0A507D967_9FUNG|nr:hypothetical protein SeLEV6574_g02283 [Synchytrium endobioticum]
MAIIKASTLLLLRRSSSSIGARVSVRSGYVLSSPKRSNACRRFASSPAHAHDHDRPTTLPPPNSMPDRYWMLASVIVYGPIFWYLTQPGDTVQTSVHDVEQAAEHVVDQVHEVTIPAAQPQAPANATATAASTSTPPPPPPPTVAAAPVLPSEPPTVEYVLVGGGTAASSAAEAIKEKDPEANVLLITEEVLVDPETILVDEPLYTVITSKENEHVSLNEEHAEKKTITTIVEDAVKDVKDAVKEPVKDLRNTVANTLPQALEKFKEAANTGKVALEQIEEEKAFPPYMRPPLSKELWFEADPGTLRFKDWNGKERSLFYQPEEYYVQVDNSLAPLYSPNSEPTKVRFLPRTIVSSIDPDEHCVFLANGKAIKYSKILIATGGTPKRLDIFDSVPAAAQKHIHTYRSINDFKFLEGQAASEKSIVVVGGGFLGSELAVALAQKKKSGIKVTQIFPEEGNLAMAFPRYLTKWTSRRIEKAGVTVKPLSVITSVMPVNDDKIAINLKSGDQVVADEVVLAVGIQPNTHLAEVSGLELDDKRGGILVNAELESRGDVFAAGDVTSYHDIALGRRRVEHHDHAVMSGRTAGENMTGKKKAYNHLSMFWSDLGPEIGYEAVGVIDSSLSTVGVWAKGNDQPRPPENAGEPASSSSVLPVDGKPDEEYGKGVVFYLSPEKQIVGVLMWNVFGKVPLARQIVKEKKAFAEINEIAGLFNVHDSV